MFYTTKESALLEMQIKKYILQQEAAKRMQSAPPPVVLKRETVVETHYIPLEGHDYFAVTFIFIVSFLAALQHIFRVDFFQTPLGKSLAPAIGFIQFLTALHIVVISSNAKKSHIHLRDRIIEETG
ncbi:MAG: hypothetical protein JWM56_359 [Candidatus Peribacteria bacterium]|nr:hypothetical protein [Candidatus Peribacteria bacterium]